MPVQLNIGKRFVVHADIALTDSEKEKGFQYSLRVPDNRGILFYYGKKGKKTFWMKNCKFPLDVIALDNRGHILGIQTLLHGYDPPRSWTTPPNTHHVLEIPGGASLRNRISRGDIVRFGQKV